MLFFAHCYPHNEFHPNRMKNTEVQIFEILFFSSPMAVAAAVAVAVADWQWLPLITGDTFRLPLQGQWLPLINGDTFCLPWWWEWQWLPLMNGDTFLSPMTATVALVDWQLLPLIYDDGGFHIQADITTERLIWAFNPNQNQSLLIFKLMIFDTYPI